MFVFDHHQMGWSAIKNVLRNKVIQVRRWHTWWTVRYYTPYLSTLQRLLTLGMEGSGSLSQATTGTCDTPFDIRHGW